MIVVVSSLPSIICILHVMLDVMHMHSRMKLYTAQTIEGRGQMTLQNRPNYPNHSNAGTRLGQRRRPCSNLEPALYRKRALRYLFHS